MTARHPYEIPEGAVREAVVNAIIHRDYMSPSKVQIRVFPNRVEIWNPGKLPPQLSLEDLKEPHPSLPYNPLLFRQFYRATYLEDVGGGTIDIIRSCKNANLPQPEFEEKMGSFGTGSVGWDCLRITPLMA
ncbi:MAG: ATP-binding protein [bacterium]|nr:ATP-binding protein [bacterium]